MSRRASPTWERPKAPPPRKLTPEEGATLDRLLDAIDTGMRIGKKSSLTNQEVREIVGETALALHGRYRKKF